MPDTADLAQPAIEAGLESSLRALRAVQAPARTAGICVDCDDPIPPKRLAALPNALRCLGCQARHEGACA